MGTLFGFCGAFDSLDALLEFLLEGFSEKNSSFVEKEGLLGIESLFIAGDQVVLGEKGFESGDDEIVDDGAGDSGCIKCFRIKMTSQAA